MIEHAVAVHQSKFRSEVCVYSSLGQLWEVGSHSSHLCAVNASVCPVLMWITGKRLGLACDNTQNLSSIKVNSKKVFASSVYASLQKLDVQEHWLPAACFAMQSVSQEFWFNELLLALDKLSCWLPARCVCCKLEDCLGYKMGQP